MQKSIATALAFIALVVLTALPASAKTKIALVLGNSIYQNTTNLKNPENDARKMTAALEKLDFEVISGTNLDKIALEKVIRRFTDALENADVALLFYAGHGLQVSGSNYLVPVDAKLARERDLDFETIKLDFVLRQMERKRRTNLVFLDACRNNPLSERYYRSTRSFATRGVESIPRGLARVSSGVGMFISYATAPGMVALDGKGENSPYTRALLKHIAKPNTSISDLMINVRRDVLSETKGKQVPWENNSLDDQFYFNYVPNTVEQAAPRKTKVTAPEPAAETAMRGNADPQSPLSAYREMRTVDTCGGYRAFLNAYPGSFYAQLASEAYKKKGCARQDAKRTGGEVKTAALEPESPPASVADRAATATPDRAALTLALQKELKRVGCDPGRADGKWGGKTRRALRNFARLTSLALSTNQPSQALIDAIRQKTNRVCLLPVQCRRGYSNDNGKCVKVKRPAYVKRDPTRVLRKKSVTTRRKSKKTKEKTYWGGEDTKTRCEQGFISNDCFGG